jgi:hypothetical protein
MNSLIFIQSTLLKLKHCRYVYVEIPRLLVLVQAATKN